MNIVFTRVIANCATQHKLKFNTSLPSEKELSNFACPGQVLKSFCSGRSSSKHSDHSTVTAPNALDKIITKNQASLSINAISLILA